MSHAVTVSKRIVGEPPQRAARHAGCAMQRRLDRRIARCCQLALLGVLTLIEIGPAHAANEAGSALRWPLAGPLRLLRGGFGESRTNRFHAGLDLSTGGQVGAEVLAPAASTLERVRTSGVGYGRSLYLKTDDGRLVLFGHLDAFAPEVAAWVDSVQRAAGAYEQDLWPPPGRFRFAAGARVAWSGQSGAGPPHLHVEIRHGDMAVNPLIAGLAVPDTVPPRIERVIFEPLDESSWVERRAAPHALPLRAEPETLLVEGRVRLTVVADDETGASGRLPVRTVGARWAGAWVECREDSISWAGEMIQFGWLVDRDRVLGSGGVILDAPAGFRPRFLTSSRPEREAVELVSVGAGDAPKPLELYARDAAGNEVTRRVYLRGPRADERGADTTAVEPRARAANEVKTATRSKKGAAAKRAPEPHAAPAPKWTFACLPEQRVRVRVTGTPPGLTAVRIERGASQAASLGAWATWDGSGYSAVLFDNGTPDADGYWIKARGADGRSWWNRGTYELWPTMSQMVARVEDWATFVIDESAGYEMGVAMVRPVPITGLPAGAVGERAAVDVQPCGLPLKKAIEMVMVQPPGLPHDRVGMCRRDDEGAEWEWSEARWDSVARTFTASTTRLGEFALVRDESPPEVTPQPAPARAHAGPYSTWALTAHAADRVSGISAEKSAFVVDGVRVPTEWDAEMGVLRWRPRVPPASGRHAFRLEVSDQAGNRTVRSGSFVIASR